MSMSRTADPLAVRLAVVIKRLRDRLRETRPDRAKQLPISRVMVIPCTGQRPSAFWARRMAVAPTDKGKVRALPSP